MWGATIAKITHEGGAGRGSARTRKGVLVVLGWVVIALTATALAIASVLLVAAAPVVGDSMTIEAFAVVSSFGSLGAAVGIAMVIVGRSFRPNFVHTRFVLWARLSGPIAILLCGGVPLWIYALVVSGSPGVDPLGPELLQFVARRSCIPFLVGIAGLVAAGIWGRRQPPPALPDIFT